MKFPDPLDDIPARQLEACALRFACQPPTSFKQIGKAMGITRQAATKLVRKGEPRWRAAEGGASILSTRASAA